MKNILRFLLILILFYAIQNPCLARSAADIEREEAARTFGTRLRNGEPLSPEENKYVEKMLRKKRISILELADHLDQSYIRSEIREERANDNYSNNKALTPQHTENPEFYSLLFVFAAAIVFTTIIVAIRFGLIYLREYMRERKNIRMWTQEDDPGP